MASGTETGNCVRKVVFMNDYKLVAPDIDRLLRFFDRGYLNPSVPSMKLCKAMEPLFSVLHNLAPLKENNEAKALWLIIPRGNIDNYDSFEDMLEYGEIENRAEYEALWLEDYPEPVSWYKLVLVEGRGKDGLLQHRAVSLGNKIIINAMLDRDEWKDESHSTNAEDAAIELCSLIMQAAEESMCKVRNGTYNDLVKLSLPYQFRTGVIQRSVVWEREPEWKEHALEGLTQAKISAFEFFLRTGANDVNRIGRLKRMTANDFFRACALGYEACGYEKTELPPADQYFIHADGRDEGLSGRGYGLNAGPGIDFDDPNAWDQWYFHREQHGGHPWEVCRGGNSTHLSLYVCHDQHDLDYLYRTNKITEDEYKKRSESAGYYYSIAGKNRAAEAVNFYVALSQAGLPVVLSDAEEIMARFEGSGYIGIVPHDVATRYCESMFPEKYGRVIDFIHVYQDELDIFGDVIEWLPEEEARIE